MIKIELNLSDCAALQQLLDVAVQKEGLRVAQVALALNGKIANAVKAWQQEQPAETGEKRQRDRHNRIA
jgi:hypothetical protein